MSLKKVFLPLIVVSTIFLLALGIVTYLVFVNQENLYLSQINRYKSYLLADELRQSSDDLTRLARTYVVSGDSKWEKQYFEVLDIRNGKQTRPKDYHRIYWDFRAADDSNVGETDIKAPLKDLMKKAGFTNKEFELLKEAENNSNNLVATEVYAMNAVKGIFDDGSGTYKIKGEPDQETAITKMHDLNYHKDKSVIMKPIDKFFVALDKRTNSSVEYYKNLASSYIYTMIGITIFLIVVMIITIVMTFNILKSLGKEPYEISEIVDKVANGDLTLRFEDVKVTGVYSSIKIMVMNLKEILTRVVDISGTLASSSEELNAFANNLSESASSQASSEEETSAATVELANSIKQVLTHTIAMQDMSEKSLHEAQDYKNNIAKVTEEMLSISESTEKIGDIIRVIDDIADQTNLLALNAAIEAARAGEHGRGFAVVADAISGLANRSAESTKEIEKLINESVKKINSGVESVKVSSESFHSIISNIEENNEIVKEITIATEEQKNGSEQIQKATDEMNNMTQNVSSSADELAGSTSELQNLAEDLTKIVSNFQLDNEIDQSGKGNIKLVQ